MGVGEGATVGVAGGRVGGKLSGVGVGDGPPQLTRTGMRQSTRSIQYSQRCPDIKDLPKGCSHKGTDSSHKDTNSSHKDTETQR
jgi:hypothetical protein